MKSRLIGLGVCLLGILNGLMSPPSLADSQSEDTVKTGFVYNFSKFIEWPASALPSNGKLQFCVAGQALEGKLSLLNGRTSQGREIQVLNLVAVSELTRCQILFIGTSEERKLGTWLAAVAEHPVLTISDIDDFTTQGGMIGLSVQNSRVTFAINLPETRAVGLKPSAQLLRLGKVVQ